MITFESLNFSPTPNKENLWATITLGNDYQIDIIKNIKKKLYIVKHFEKTFDRKRYLPNTFEGYEGFPAFPTREALIVFLNENNHEIEEEL